MTQINVKQWSLKNPMARDIYKAYEKTNNKDTIYLHKGNHVLKESLLIDKDIAIKGHAQTRLITLKEAKNGLLLNSHNQLRLERLNLFRQEEAVSLYVQDTFKGSLRLSQVTSDWEYHFGTTDNRYFPALYIEGRGTLEIKNSTIDQLYIHAPEMTVLIQNSTIGTLARPSKILAQTVDIYDTTLNHIHFQSPATLKRIRCHGGLINESDTTVNGLELVPSNKDIDQIAYVTSLKGRVRLNEVECHQAWDNYLVFSIQNSELEIRKAHIVDHQKPNLQENSKIIDPNQQITWQNERKETHGK